MAQDNKNKILNVPPLRFPGFTEPWDIAFLENYLIENKERNKNGDFTKNDVLSVSGEQGVVNQIELLGRSFAGKSVIPYHIARHNNIIYTKSPLSDFPYGIVKMNRGVDGIVSTLYAVYNVLPNADASFIEFYFALKHRANRYFKPIVRIGAKHDMKIGNAEVLHNLVKFPKIEEQQRISKFFELIDERIATQNKIIEDLKKLKSAIIERLFCEKNTTRIRLGDIGTFVRGLTYNSDNVCDNSSATTVIRANNLDYGEEVNYKEDVVYVKKDVSPFDCLKKGDIAICMANGSSSLVGKNSIYTGQEANITVGAFCGIYRSKYPLIRWLLQTNQYKRNVYQSLQGGNGAIANLNREDILNMYFNIPSTDHELAVYQCLYGLDGKIKTEQELLGLYGLQKKHLISQMFI